MTIQFVSDDNLSVQRHFTRTTEKKQPCAPSTGQKTFISAMQYDDISFNLEKWFNSFVEYISELRNFPVLPENRKKLFLAELKKRNVNRELCISIEIGLITGQLTVSKIQNGLDISDFFPDTITCTRADLNIQYRRGYQAAIEEQKNKSLQVHTHIDINDDLVRQIETMSQATMALRREKNLLLMKLQHIRNKCAFREDNETVTEIDRILNAECDELPFGIIGEVPEGDQHVRQET